MANGEPLETTEGTYYRVDSLAGHVSILVPAFAPVVTLDYRELREMADEVERQIIDEATP